MGRGGTMEKGRGPGEGGEQVYGGGDPHIGKSSHVLGESLSRHHILAALTQPLCGRFNLLGQILAHLSGL